MAGGWGASVQAPMEIPREKPHRYLGQDLPVTNNPRQTELPVIRDSSAQTALLATKAMPSMPGGKITQSGRMEEAAEYAYAMGKAFGITKAYNKAYAARAKAKGRANERMSKTYSKDSVNYGKSRSHRNKAIERNSMNNAARSFGYNPWSAMY